MDGRITMMRTVLVAAIAFRLLTLSLAVGDDLALTPDLSSPDCLEDWVRDRGTWSIADGILEQSDFGCTEDYDYRGVGHLFLKQPAMTDFTLSFDFCMSSDPKAPVFRGSKLWDHRAAEVIFRSATSRQYYIAQFSAQNSFVRMAKCTPRQFWTDIARRDSIAIAIDTWHQGRIEAQGSHFRVFLDGQRVLKADDASYGAGTIGFGSSNAKARFRNIRLEGSPTALKEAWKLEGPPDSTRSGERIVVCADGGAGPYQAFPDTVRLQNGDLLTVFYAGYEHISLPNAKLPRGARIAAVRSGDDGKTWSKATLVADTLWDDRDPSICQLPDGTLICNWFTFQGRKNSHGETVFKEIWLAFSNDDGHTWSEPQLIPSTAGENYACTSPIRRLPDASLVMPIYKQGYEGGVRQFWTYMIFSNDAGKTWSEPAAVDPENNDLDEPDVISLPSGDLLCIMRSADNQSGWKSISKDGGRTWTKAVPLEFPGCCAYLYRTSKGILLCGHRWPGTSVNYSLDEGQTWSDNIQIDTHDGAYPSMAELPDGRILFVYFDEATPISAIQSVSFGVTAEGIELGKISAGPSLKSVEANAPVNYDSRIEPQTPADE